MLALLPPGYCQECEPHGKPLCKQVPNVGGRRTHPGGVAWGLSYLRLRKHPDSESLTACEAAHVTQRVHPRFSFYMFDDFLIT